MCWQLGGLCTAVPSPTGVVHDSSPPTTAAARIVASAGAAIDVTAAEPAAYYQTDDSAIHASWVPFADPHTSVVSLEVGLGTSGVGTNIVEFQSVAVTASSISFTPPAPDTAFLPGLGYRVVFRVTNAAGATAVTSTAPLVIDATPPVVDWVVDVFPVEVAGIDTYFTDDNGVGDVDLTDASAVRAKFHCTDAETAASGVSSITYEWRVCDTAACDATVYQDWTPTGATPRGTAPGTILSGAQAAGTLTSVFVQARCTNGAGLNAIGASDGVVYDLTPADTTTAVVLDLEAAAAPGSEQLDIDWTSSDVLDIAWSGFVTPPGRPAIVGYSFALGTAPGLADVAPFTPVGLATTAETNAIAGVADGTVVYVTVEVVTASGAISSVSSDGVGIDRVAPVPTVVDSKGPFLASDPQRCAPHLQCVDLAGVGTTSDISYIATSSTVSFAVTARTGTAPIDTLGYGASSCDPASLLDLNVVPLQIASDPAATAVSMENLFLSHGQEVCAVAFYTGVTGLGAYGASDGIVVDLTPPIAEVATEGTSAAVDDDVVAVLDSVTVTLQCADPDSGVHHADVAIHRVAFASGAVLDTALPWTPVSGSAQPPSATGTPITETITGLSLALGEYYVTSVRCVNEAGAYATLDTDGFFVDTTPPDSATARVQHSVHDLTVAVQVETGQLEASWSGFSDPESGIVGFAWAIGSTAGATDVLPHTPLGAAASAHTTLPLQDGETYFVTVYATNGAGLVSSATSGGVTVDGSAPPAVTGLELAPDGDNDGVAWVQSSASLTATWTGAADPHTDVSYKWTLGSSPHGQQLVQWTDVGSAMTASIAGLSLIPGVRYYASVESTNEAGLRAHVASGALAVDPVAPVKGRVVDGTLSIPARYQLSTDQLSCAWAGFVDRLSGIASYHVGFGSVPGTADIAPFVVLSPGSASHVVSGLTLVTGSEYYCTVVAYDEVGNSASVSSNGVIVDSTPPEVGQVLDIAPTAVLQGLGTLDIDTIVAPSTISAAWPGWSDPESGVDVVEWAVGTTMGGTDVLDWTVVSGAMASASLDLAAAGTTIAAGTTVYASVRMSNALQQVSQAVSDGVTVLAAPAAAGSSGLIVNAEAVTIPPTPLPDASDRTWCACGAAEASGGVFDPAAGSCSCGPGTYLDVGSGLCTACPATTCKPTIGNAFSLCDASFCGLPDDTLPTSPPAASSLSACGAAGSGRVVNPSDSTCVCPAGTHTSGSSSPCLACDAGTVNPFIANVPTCAVCGEPSVPDVVLHVSWNDYEAVIGQPLSSIVVSVGTSPGALRWQKVVSPTQSFVQFSSRDTDPPPLYAGSQLWVRVRMEVASVRRLAAGDPEVVADESVGVQVNLAPPTPGQVIDGAQPVDISVQSSATEVSASWYGFSANGVINYDVAFGSTGPFSTDVLDFHDVGPALQHVATVPSGLVAGTTIHATVRATTEDGLWSWASSNGVLVQPTLSGGVVSIDQWSEVASRGGPTGNTHLGTITEVAGIAATWQFDDSSGLVYDWAVVDLDEQDSLGHQLFAMPYTSVGSASWGAATLAAPLQGGHRYAVRVRATSAAGVQHVVESLPAVVDTASASPPTVVLSPGSAPTNPTHALQSYQGSTASLQVSWQCSEGDVAATHVLVSVGSVADGSQVLDQIAYPVGDSPITLEDLDLRHDHCYTAQVQCTSPSSTSSAGVSQAICVDVTRAAAAVSVFHPLRRAIATGQATAVDITTQSSLADTHGLDPEHVGSVGVYAASVFDDLPSETIYVSPTLDLPAEVQLRASDSTSGVTYMDIAWATSSSGADAVIDSTSVVGRKQIPSTSIDMLGRGVTAGSETFSSIGSAAPTGTPLHAHLRVYNGVGDVSRAVAGTSIVFDATAPELTLPLSLPASQRSTTRMDWTWLYHDTESSVLVYVWSIHDGDGVTIVPPTTTATPEASASGLGLVHGQSYVATVTACNHALVCRSDTATVVVDSTPPEAGTVYLGVPDEDLAAQLCESRPCDTGPPAVASAHDLGPSWLVSWAHFDDTESGIANYLVSVGTSPHGSQLADPVSIASTTRSADLVGLISTSGPQVLLVDGDAVYVTVTAVNGLGETSSTTALLLVLDATPPASTLVRFVGTAVEARVTAASATVAVDGGSDSGPRLAQSDTQTASVTWTLPDDSSDIVRIDVAVFDASGVAAAGPTTVDVAAGSHTWVGLSLIPGVLHRAVITLFDHVGNRLDSKSSEQLVVDTTPPVQLRASTSLDVGIVRDGLISGSDSDCQSQTGRALDGTAGLVVVTVTGQNATETTLPDVFGEELGNFTTVDTSPPNATVGRLATTTLQFHADPFVDPESGVSSVHVAVGTSRHGADVMRWTLLPTASVTAVQVAFDKQPEGSILFVSLRATNAAGLTADATSDGIRLLCDPGTDGCKYDGTFVCI